MDKKMFTVTIGIPAHNEEKNIDKLLKSLLRQKTNNFTLEKIIVYSDASTDNTEKIVSSFKNKVKLLSGKKQIGQLQGINTILKNSSSDIVVLIDADVAVKKNTVISKLVEPFYENNKIGLVGGNRKVFKAKTFIEEAIHTSIRAYDNIAFDLKNGNNPYNCHGCVLALSKNFYQNIELPKQIFSGDTFLYFSCLNKKMLFKFAPEAEVYVYTANNLRDTLLQYKRFLAIDTYSEKKFKK
jgi:glycosyltransferase involved in cell wall biosynthesis